MGSADCNRSDRFAISLALANADWFGKCFLFFTLTIWEGLPYRLSSTNLSSCPMDLERMF